MVKEVILDDIMLNDEPLGLAEDMTSIRAFATIISSDDEAAPGEIVYFGVDLPIGDIGEVKGKVLSCEKTDDIFRIEIEVMSLDIRYVDLLTRALTGETSDKEAGDQPVWGLGLKQTNGAMATLVNSPAGLLNSDQIRKICELTEKGYGLAKLTHAQRVILLLKPEQLDTVREEVASVGLRLGVLHTGIRNIRGCCGALCKWAQGTDGLGMALEIDKAIYGRPMKFDVKIAVSDCLRNCMESYCVDIGFIAQNGKYDVYVGGCASSVHLKGLKVTTGVPKNAVIPVLEKILQWYDDHANRGERIYKTLERLGAPLTVGRNLSVFDQAAQVFAGTPVDDNLAQNLTRNLYRGFAVKRMQNDLGFV